MTRKAAVGHELFELGVTSTTLQKCQFSRISVSLSVVFMTTALISLFTSFLLAYSIKPIETCFATDFSNLMLFHQVSGLTHCTNIYSKYDGNIYSYRSISCVIKLLNNLS